VYFVLTWGLLKMCEVLQPEADKNVEEKIRRQFMAGLLYIISGIIAVGLLAYLLCRTIETGDYSNDAMGILHNRVLYRSADALAKPLGAFMARVYQREKTFLDPVFGPLERLIYRLAKISPGRGDDLECESDSRNASL